ncbi:hypothetical protein GF391_01850 [Candidatus Uhrbacteria bacterium]|nr:hypothetical protein [Candidatus Uhrbacteria bacterium]
MRMQKGLFRNILTTVILLITGSDLIISFPTNELAAFVGAFYLFFSVQIAITSGKQIIAYADERAEQTQIFTVPAQINLKCQLAREKYRYNNLEIEQARRAARIVRLEARLAQEEPDPYRIPPCRGMPWI